MAAAVAGSVAQQPAPGGSRSMCCRLAVRGRRLSRFAMAVLERRMCVLTQSKPEPVRCRTYA